MAYVTTFASPIGIVEIRATNTHITSVLFVDAHGDMSDTTPLLDEAVQQLTQYFQHERQTFTLPIQQQGTAFQQRVWQALTGITYGNTASYKDIAHAIHHDKAVRAVGMANSKNKLTIIVPCHRVIRANGQLSGYAGEVWRKQWLLQHELGGTS